MADIYEIAERYRKALLVSERKAATEMVRAYGESWKRIKTNLDTLTAQITAARAAGEEVSAAWLFQRDRLAGLQRQVESEIGWFAQHAEASVIAQQAEAVRAAEAHAMELMGTSLGTAPPGVMLTFNRLPSGAVQDLVGFLQDGSPLRSLLDELGPEASQGVRDALIAGVATGQGPREIARRARLAMGGNLVRALTIARTEVLRSYRESSRRSYQANDDVVKGWVWHSALGTRTCASCWALHGTFHQLDERLDDHPNGRCLTPGTLVSGPTATAFVARYYEGDVVSIKTASGKLLTVTPNHPILTDRGWLAANLLQVGDNVISDGGDQRGAPGVCPDDYQVPALVENIASALGMGVLGSMPTAPEDFHGDGVGSEVHVVYADSFLWHRADASVYQPALQEYFTGRSIAALSLAPDSAPDLLINGDAPSTNSVLSNLDAAMMFFDGDSCLRQPVGCSHVAPLHTSDPQPSCNRTARDTKASRQRIFGFPGQIASSYLGFGKGDQSATGGSAFLANDLVSASFVSQQSMSLEVIREALLRSVESSSGVLHALASNVSLDRIVEISVGTFSGHVYNLQTQVGWYSANGIITHNCAMVPLTKTWEELGFEGIPETRAKVEKGTDLFEKLSDADKERVLGKAGFQAYKAGAVKLGDFVGRKRNKTWGTTRYARSLRDILGPDEAKKWMAQSIDREAISQRMKNQWVSAKARRDIRERQVATMSDTQLMREIRRHQQAKWRSSDLLEHVKKHQRDYAEFFGHAVGSKEIEDTSRLVMQSWDQMFTSLDEKGRVSYTFASNWEQAQARVFVTVSGDGRIKTLIPSQQFTRYVGRHLELVEVTGRVRKIRG